MREFTDFEKQIIEKIVVAEDLKESCLAKLIDENTDAISFEWDIDKPSFYIIYRPTNLSDDDLFNQIQEIIFLLKSLEESNLIYLHQNEESNEDNCLYNRVRYKRENPREYSVIVNIPDTKGFISTNIFEIETDFGKYVQRYTVAFFYASNALRILVTNGYKTPEQLHFEEQLKDADEKHKVAMEKAQAQVKYSRWAFYGSIVAFLASSVFGVVQMYSETTIDKDQLNQIKQTIEQKNLPDVIKTEITNDTLTTRVVEKPQTRSKKQIK
jgi:hypothetical protein